MSPEPASGRDDETLREAARLVHAEEILRRTGEGLDSVLAERGANLSQGQRQLISFARALAKLEPKLGKTHPQTLTVRTNRALARWGAQKNDAAAAKYAAVVKALAVTNAEEGADE